MRQGRFGGVGAWAVTLWLLSAPGQAQPPRAAQPALDEQAMAVLQRMAAFLTQAQRFSVNGGPRSRRRPLSATQHNPTTSLVDISFHCHET